MSLRPATYRWEHLVDDAGKRWVLVRDLDPAERDRPWCWPIHEAALAEAFWKALQDESAARDLHATFIRMDP